MRYEKVSVDFIFPSELSHNGNMIGEIDRIDISSLPHKILDENHIYDRGKRFG